MRLTTKASYADEEARLWARLNTRAALLLFGKDESAQFLPLPPQVSWVLKGGGAYYRANSR